MTDRSAYHARANAVVAPLFVPALEQRKLEKAERLADAVIIDLEDAVADTMKDQARDWLANLKEPVGPAQRWVRVNEIDSGRCADDIAALDPHVSAIILPMCDSPEHIDIAAAELRRAGRDAVIIPLIETARGLQRVAEITARGQAAGLARVGLGMGDMSNDLNLSWEPDSPFATYSRCAIAVASRAARIGPALDSVVPRIGDLEGLAADTARARAMGFGGKMCIYPTQVPVVQAGFAPSERELSRALEIIEAFTQATADGRAAVVVDGLFIDYPVAEQAQSLLARSGQSSPPISRTIGVSSD
jgi:citrate lyase subunit beta / citryl-CoA lyase